MCFWGTHGRISQQKENFYSKILRFKGAHAPLRNRPYPRGVGRKSWFTPDLCWLGWERRMKHRFREYHHSGKGFESLSKGLDALISAFSICRKPCAYRTVDWRHSFASVESLGSQSESDWKAVLKLQSISLRKGIAETAL